LEKELVKILLCGVGLNGEQPFERQTLYKYEWIDANLIPLVLMEQAA
jgi:hypothetical protein